MSQEIKIVRFQMDEAALRTAEREIARRVNAHWVIVSAGGASSGTVSGGDTPSDLWGVLNAGGFVILQRGRPEPETEPQ
ncbi:MAG: hypothetical protein KA764_07055 [Anaerolineales bacterium]|nr:hypothetical protein [Anaerolineales bacterium]